MYTETSRTFVRNVIDADCNEAQIEIVLSTDDLIISRPLAEEARDVAALIGQVGDLIGSWMECVELADARYRRWRGQQTESILGASDKAPAEFKVTAAREAHPEFLQHKTEIAQLTGELEFLRAYYAALQVKAGQIGALITIEVQAGR